jgi:polysaccharide deacetylase family protein (PEP-CTERM system associated)
MPDGFMGGEPRGRVRHGLTVDVEEWFDTEAVRPRLPAGSPGPRSAVEQTTEMVLDLLAGAGARATFFCLGRLADERPAVVRRIVAEGHELASHGYSHQQVQHLGPRALAEDLHRAKARLEDVGGVAVAAHRCASWSLRGNRLWALEVIAAAGFTCDASLHPAGTLGFGTRGVPRGPHRVRLSSGAELREFPPAVAGWPVGLPCGGGFFLRTLPVRVVRDTLAGSAARGQPAVIYLHPWELDPAPPRARLPLPWRLVQYHGLGHMRARVERLLATFPFAPLREVADAVEWSAAPVFSVRTGQVNPH